MTGCFERPESFAAHSKPQATQACSHNYGELVVCYRYFAIGFPLGKISSVAASIMSVQLQTAKQIGETLQKGAQHSSSYSFRLLESKQDVPAVIELARAAHEESRLGYIPFSEKKTRRIAEQAMKNPKRHAVMLAFKSDQPVGLLYCSVGEYHIGEGVLLATIHNINVLKEVRASLGGGRAALGLLRGASTWAEARNARELLLHATSDVELPRLHKLAKRAGFKFVGGSYAKTS